MSEDETAIALSKDEVLSSILSPDPNRNRDEPAIAANISAQLNHMGLDTWSISVLRRLRDAVGRIKPDRIIEVGGGIGHRTAWIYDFVFLLRVLCLLDCPSIMLMCLYRAVVVYIALLVRAYIALLSLVIIC